MQRLLVFPKENDEECQPSSAYRYLLALCSLGNQHRGYPA
jgi:hypothetical protein